MKYTDIIQSVERQILDGLLKPGSKLPSIRALTESYSCSKNTAIRAYAELEKRHIIYAVPKSGYYVVEGRGNINLSNPADQVIDFRSAGPDKTVMPYRDFQHCMNQAIEIYKEELFTYSQIPGLQSLRVELARHLLDLQVFTAPERIFVVSGSQQALHLLVSLPFPNGKNNICVEQPTHFSMMDSLKIHQAVTYGIEVTKNGIDFGRLEDIFKTRDIKFFYTVSRFHNPTGYSYTNVEKKRIVELAQKYDVYIIEDDYMGDLDPDSKHDPMFAFDPSGRVIYTKSFSKVMLPGLRLGLAVIPEAMSEIFQRAKHAADIHSPVLMQGALEIYLKNGMFRAHIQRMRQTYSKKGALLQQAYQTHLPPFLSFTGSPSGFYSTIQLPEPLKAYQLVHYLENENVYAQDASSMFLPEFKNESMIRLSVSQVKEELIEIGVQKIAEGAAELLKRRSEVRFI